MTSYCANVYSVRRNRWISRENAKDTAQTTISKVFLCFIIIRQFLKKQWGLMTSCLQFLFTIKMHHYHGNSAPYCTNVYIARRNRWINREKCKRSGPKDHFKKISRFPYNSSQLFRYILGQFCHFSPLTVKIGMCKPFICERSGSKDQNV